MLLDPGWFEHYRQTHLDRVQHWAVWVSVSQTCSWGQPPVLFLCQCGGDRQRDLSPSGVPQMGFTVLYSNSVSPGFCGCVIRWSPFLSWPLFLYKAAALVRKCTVVKPRNFCDLGQLEQVFCKAIPPCPVWTPCPLEPCCCQSLPSAWERWQQPAQSWGCTWAAHPSGGWVGTEPLGLYAPAGDVTVRGHPAWGWQCPHWLLGAAGAFSPATWEMTSGPPFWCRSFEVSSGEK